MKTGTNFADRNAILDWAKQGKSAEFISDALKINIDSVRGCMKANGCSDEPEDPEEEDGSYEDDQPEVA